MRIPEDLDMVGRYRSIVTAIDATTNFMKATCPSPMKSSANAGAQIAAWTLVKSSGGVIPDSTASGLLQRFTQDRAEDDDFGAIQDMLTSKGDGHVKLSEIRGEKTRAETPRGL